MPDEVSIDSTEVSTPIVFNSGGAPTVEFSLPDMMCEDGCALAVNDILSRQPGVSDVAVDFEGKTATVAVDEDTFDSEEALAELVDKGFLKSTLVGDLSPATQEASGAPAQPAAPSSPSD